ncbi:MAG: phage tail sheath subtilisin-like domain-containing protein [Endomicrobiia bacterium]
MSLITRFFAGYEIILPGAYINRKITGDFGNTGTLGNVLFLVGESEGGIPYNAKDYDEITDLAPKYKVNQLTKIQDAYDKLIDGELFNAARFAFTPAIDSRFTAPPIINCIRVNNATRSSLIEKETKPNGNDCAKWQSVDFGTHVNTISKKISNGTISGKKIQIQYKGQTKTLDNIEKKDFGIRYIGAETTATITINATDIIIVAGSETLFNISKATYKTIGEVVDLLQTNLDLSINLIGERDWETKYLDYVSNQDIKTSEYAVKSDAEWIMRMVNNSFGDLVYYSLITTTTRKPPANDNTFVYLTGGTKTNATNNDWANVLVMLENLNVDYLVLLNSSLAVQTMLKSHCEYMNSVSGMNERLGFTGSGLTTTKADIITNVKSINSSSIIYASSRFKNLDQFGVEKNWAGYHLSAMIASLMAGNGRNFAITLKQMNVNGLSDNWSLTDLKDLIKARTIVLMEDQTGGTFSVQRALTTYQGEYLLMSSPAAMSCMLNLSKDLRSKIRQKIADLNTTFNAAVINIIKNYIEKEVLPNYKQQGLLTDDPETGRPAFSNIQFKAKGDEFSVSFDGVVPTELNFVFITGNFNIVGQI